MFLYEAVDILSRLRHVATTQRTDDGQVVHIGRVGKKLRCGMVWHATLDQWPGIVEHAEQSVALMRRAMPFVFRQDARGDLATPKIGPAGMRIFNDGHLSLPSDVVWLECPGRDKDIGILVAKTSGSAIDVRVFGYLEQPKNFMGPTVGRVVEYSCYRTTIQPNSPSVADRPCDLPPVGDSVFTFRSHDPLGHAAAWRRHVAADIGDNPEIDAKIPAPLPGQDPASGWWTAPSGYALMDESKALHAVYLLLLLMSRKKTVETVTPGKMENHRRANKGLFKIPPHHVVTPTDDWTPEDGFSSRHLLGLFSGKPAS